jgi:hypothetical protein
MGTHIAINNRFCIAKFAEPNRLYYGPWGPLLGGSFNELIGASSAQCPLSSQPPRGGLYVSAQIPRTTGVGFKIPCL